DYYCYSTDTSAYHRVF
nr:immunoglobulin light chain junction region [Macaca mulatta]